MDLDKQQKQQSNKGGEATKEQQRGQTCLLTEDGGDIKTSHAKERIWTAQPRQHSYAKPEQSSVEAFPLAGKFRLVSRITTERCIEKLSLKGQLRSSKGCLDEVRFAA